MTKSTLNVIFWGVSVLLNSIKGFTRRPMFESTLMLHSRREYLYRYHKPREILSSYGDYTGASCGFLRGQLFSSLPRRQSASTKRKDTSRACICNILVSTISRSALCRLHRLRMRKRKSIYICRSYNGESEVKEEERERENLSLIYYIYEKF